MYKRIVSPALTALLMAAVAGTMLALSAGTARAQSEPLPDLTVEKVGPTIYREGDYSQYDYQIVVSNVGSGSATISPGTVLFTDDMRVLGKATSTLVGLGSGASGAIEANWYAGSANVSCVHSAICTLHAETIETGGHLEVTDVIQPGEDRSGFTVHAAFIGESEPKGGVIRNCATVDPNNVIPESNESNNTDCIVTSLTKIAA